MKTWIFYQVKLGFTFVQDHVKVFLGQVKITGPEFEGGIFMSVFEKLRRQIAIVGDPHSPHL
jgi:hypothetical protein